MAFGMEASFHLGSLKEIPKNRGTSLWNFVTNFGFYKISPRQVDHVVNKTHRRSRLLTTLARVARRGIIYYTSVDYN